MKPALLGVDVGTSGAKTLLLDPLGRVLGESTRGYGTSTPRPLWSEQDPERWWNAAVKGIRDVLKHSQVRPSDIAAIGLTGQMHGLVLLDGKNQVLRPCILWNDQRTADQCRAMTERIGATRIIQLTGNSLLPGFTAPKLEWVRENEPEVFARIARILLPKDYLRFRFTGEFFSEVSDASGTSLFDVGRRWWSDEMRRAFKVRRAWLPEVTESPVVSAQVSAAAAQITGLRAGMLVVGGAGDQAAGGIGAGAISEGIISVVIGTSGVVFAANRTYRCEPQGKLHSFCHAVPNTWHLMGVMLAAGGSLRWYCDALGDAERAQARKQGIDPYELLTRAAAKAPAGAEGLLFLPYLSGERTPYPDPLARGVFFGLNLKHTKAHLTRAVLEGVSFGLRDSLELIMNLRVPVRQVRVVGGGAHSRLWRQILADVLEQPIFTVNVAQGAAYGAALLAGVGAGVFFSVEDACNRTIKAKLSAKPGPDAETYRKYYPRYRALYAALRQEFKKMAELSGSSHR
jgi:xylulokinase